MASAESVAAQAEDWLRDAAFPLWLERGLDHVHGGFHELLSLDRAESAADYKRVRVIARQIYVFATAHRLRVSGAMDAVRHGLTFLLGPCRHGDGGFVTRVANDGRHIDTGRELYEQAFVLFALGHAYQVLGDRALREEAHALLAFIKARMVHPSGGYHEAVEPTSPERRQNPHMHLLEAALVWTCLEPDGPWRALALELAGLFTSKFFRRSPGVLLEFFDQDLSPQVGPRGKITEPGHHFEWVWLLSRVEAVCGVTVAGAAELYAFAHAHGFSRKHDLIAAEVDTAGARLGPVTRVWPHTEWLKAEAVTPGAGAEARLERAWARLARMFETPVKGLWIENWNIETGEPLSIPAPASTFYHILLALEVVLAKAGRHPAPFGVSGRPGCA